jgi:uncharacterized protein YybS (DUF2232 family)
LTKGVKFSKLSEVSVITYILARQDKLNSYISLCTSAIISINSLYFLYKVNFLFILPIDLYKTDYKYSLYELLTDWGYIC